jgi:hypothetical protein
MDTFNTWRYRNGEVVVVPDRLAKIERQIRRLRKQRKNRQYADYADLPEDFVIDAAKRLPDDDARRDAADALRDQAEESPERKAKLLRLVEKIEGLCDTPPAVRSRPSDVTADDWHIATERHNTIVDQMNLVESKADQEWILRANINHLLNKTTKTAADKLTLQWLMDLDRDRGATEVEYQHGKRAVNPWEVDAGGKAKSRNKPRLHALDHTTASETKRKAAWQTTRRVDPKTGQTMPMDEFGPVRPKRRSR